MCLYNEGKGCVGEDFFTSLMHLYMILEVSSNNTNLCNVSMSCVFFNDFMRYFDKAQLSVSFCIHCLMYCVYRCAYGFWCVCECVCECACVCVSVHT